MNIKAVLLRILNSFYRKSVLLDSLMKLKHFDAFCVKESIIQPYLSRELVKKWGTLREGEALSTCSARTSITRQFALFIISLGEEAYIPSNFYKCEKRLVHVLSDDEISAFVRS